MNEYAYKTNPNLPVSQSNKVLGSGEYDVDNADSCSIAYTGIWRHGVIVALAVAASDLEDDIDPMEVSDVLKFRAENITHRLNGYDVLMEFYAASVSSNNSHGDLPDGWTLQQAVEYERRVEERLEAAQKAVQELIGSAP